MGPLAGIRVLEWAAFFNGPAAGYMLGDLGAEVIKIEQPGVGDPIRNRLPTDPSFLPGGRIVEFDTANRNKKGVALDLEKEQGKQIAYRLAQKCDVFITNYRPGVLERMRMDYATLSQYNPKLIYAHNSAYGRRGALSEKRAFDPVAQARSGFMYLTSDDGIEQPLRTVGAVFDQMGATMLAYGILAALVARERLGIGQELEASLYGSAIHLQGHNVNRVCWTGKPQARHYRSKAVNPLSNLYQCADDKWLLLAEPDAQSPRFWQQFCQALGLEELERDERYATAAARRVNRKELIAILAQVLTSRDRDEWIRHFEEQGCQFAYSPVYTPQEAVADPQALENEYLVSTEHPTLGTVKTVGFPVQFSRTPAQIRCPAPELGQHTEQVLMELGEYSRDEIAQLRAEGII